jgi:hypothetical protein
MGETKSFAYTGRGLVGYVSFTSFAMELGAGGKTTIAEAIATTSGLDDPLEETRSLRALKLPVGENGELLDDAILSGHGG